MSGKTSGTAARCGRKITRPHGPWRPVDRPPNRPPWHRRQWAVRAADPLSPIARPAIGTFLKRRWVVAMNESMRAGGGVPLASETS